MPDVRLAPSILSADFGCLGHQGDDIGLGDGLAKADGQRMIRVGLILIHFRNEEVAWYGTHSLDDGFVFDAIGDNAGVDQRFTPIKKGICGKGYVRRGLAVCPDCWRLPGFGCDGRFGKVAGWAGGRTGSKQKETGFEEYSPGSG